MDSAQGTLASSSSVTNFKQRPPSSWVPYAGTKRKAHIANLGDNYDPDCRPSPAKQFAVDEEVAPEILRNGFYYDPSHPPPSNENQCPADEVEMDELPPIDFNAVYMKGPGETTHSTSASSSSTSHESMSQRLTSDEKECRDDSVIRPHSMHESQPISPYSKAQSMVMKDVSLILSNEIQETLTRRKLSEGFILPKSIMNQVSGKNTSMALVPWKPPVKMESLVIPQQEPAAPKDRVLRQFLEPVIHSIPPPLPLPIIQLTPPPAESLSPTISEEDGESMDVDMVF